MGFTPGLKACPWPGCDQLVDNAVACPAHLPPSSAARRGYDQRWRVESAAWLKAHPRCARCGRTAQLVDHKIPVIAGIDRFDQANWQGLCRSCHAHKTRLTQLEWRGRYWKPRQR